MRTDKGTWHVSAPCKHCGQTPIGGQGASCATSNTEPPSHATDAARCADFSLQQLDADNKAGPPQDRPTAVSPESDRPQWWPLSSVYGLPSRHSTASTFAERLARRSKPKSMQHVVLPFFSSTLVSNARSVNHHESLARPTRRTRPHGGKWSHSPAATPEHTMFTNFESYLLG